jgi:excisionase family DNA binding protein
MDATIAVLAKALSEHLSGILRAEIEHLSHRSVAPALLTVREAGIYLGRSEQAIQHLIFQRDLPVVRVGRRVHLDRRDLDAFIEKHKY